jgi:hypothetical protein
MAPISDINVQQEDRSTATDTTGTAAEPTSTQAVVMIAGIGGVIAASISAAVRYLKRAGIKWWLQPLRGSCLLSQNAGAIHATRWQMRLITYTTDNQSPAL